MTGVVAGSRMTAVGAWWARLGPDMRPWRASRDFRLLLTSGLVTTFGTFITFVALAVQLKQLTGSTVAVGLLGAVELVPLVVCGLYGGALADWLDRRRMIIGCEAALGVLSGVLLANALLPHPYAWPLYVVAALIAALDGLQRPSLEALIPRIVVPEQLTAAAALSSIQRNFAAIVGPSVGGVLIAGVGLPLAYGTDIVSYLLSLTLLIQLRAAPPAPDAERPSIAGIVAGLRYARGNQVLIGTYVVDLAAMLLAMPTALLPFVADDLHAPWSLGLLYGAGAVGSMLASLTSGWASRLHRQGLGVVLAATCWGLAVTAFGMVHSVWLAVAFLVLAGAADMYSGIWRMSIWNRTIPDRLRGRLAGIELLSYSVGPSLGQLRAGGMAAVTGVRASIVGGGLLCVGAVGALTAVLPRFRAYDERTAAPKEDTSVGEAALS
jgi:MFS family permease